MSEAVIQAKISRMGGGMADSHFCNATLRLVSPQGKLGWWRTATLPCCHTHGDRTRCASCACSGLCFCVPSRPPWEGSAAVRARAFNKSFHILALKDRGRRIEEKNDVV